jgi:L-fuconate dehydratase
VLLADGYACYTTSAGWLGYDDEKLRRLAQEAIDAGFNHIKMKVGVILKTISAASRIAREVIGPDRYLMIDANQVWEVGQAIDWVNAGLCQAVVHRGADQPRRCTATPAKSARRSARSRSRPARCARTASCSSSSSPKARSISCRSTACRMGGLNEVLAVLLMAAKFGLPVWPHAGGVGLCEYVQHLSMIDYLVFRAPRRAA